MIGRAEEEAAEDSSAGPRAGIAALAVLIDKERMLPMDYTPVVEATQTMAEEGGTGVEHRDFVVVVCQQEGSAPGLQLSGAALEAVAVRIVLEVGLAPAEGSSLVDLPSPGEEFSKLYQSWVTAH